jgi:hypothetical protein
VRPSAAGAAVKDRATAEEIVDETKRALGEAKK